MAKKKTADPIETAKLVDNEPLISKELADKYRKSVEELKAKQNNFIGSNIKEPTKANNETFLKSKEDSKAIGTSEKTSKPSAKAGPKKTTVAIFSERNVSWIGVGTVSKGYNIVTKEEAAKWLTRNHVREATPEEVAAEFGA